MRIVLFRHAPAEPRDPERWSDDLLRPLTSRGEVRARRAVRGIVMLEPGLRRVLTSPAIRALKTAEILAGELTTPTKVQELPSLAPGGSWRETLRALAREPINTVVALVGHEPDLSELASALQFGAPAAVPLRKAGACAIEMEALEPAAGQLRWFLGPGALRSLAKKRSKA
jgi:phosphohistidine phosphatase